MGVTSRLTVPCQLSQKVDVGVTIPIFKEQMNALGFGHLPELPLPAGTSWINTHRHIHTHTHTHTRTRTHAHTHTHTLLRLKMKFQ